MKITGFAFAVLCLLSCLPVTAHHSAAAFDPNLDVNITGTVARLEWTSPHARLYVDEILEDGTVIHWNFELPSPVSLMRKGWRPDDVVPGEEVTVTGFRAREFPDIAIAERVFDRDGNQLFAGN